MMVNLDPPASALVWLLQFNGYRVEVQPDGQSLQRGSPSYRASAVHPTEPAQVATAADPYAAICELAELCGMELEDG
ncbi:MAG TPA: hypothetical protein PKK06_05040 [Phycisphaerae bacterium]|nr:hypothetical protein [Phycisphaerae bacterium]